MDLEGSIFHLLIYEKLKKDMRACSFIREFSVLIQLNHCYLAYEFNLFQAAMLLVKIYRLQKN